jgi:hypothetical protein
MFNFEICDKFNKSWSINGCVWCSSLGLCALKFLIEYFSMDKTSHPCQNSHFLGWINLRMAPNPSILSLKSHFDPYGYFCKMLVIWSTFFFLFPGRTDPLWSVTSLKRLLKLTLSLATIYQFKMVIVWVALSQPHINISILNTTTLHINIPLKNNLSNKKRDIKLDK